MVLCPPSLCLGACPGHLEGMTTHEIPGLASWRRQPQHESWRNSKATWMCLSATQNVTIFHLEWMGPETKSHFPNHTCSFASVSNLYPLISFGKRKLHEFTEREIIAVVRLHVEGLTYLSWMGPTFPRVSCFYMIECCLGAFPPLWLCDSEKTMALVV